MCARSIASSGRAFIGCAVFCAAIGCGPGIPDPAEQFRVALENLKAGELAGAYRALMPERYDRDLNDLLDRLRSLVAPEDLPLLSALAAKIGDALAEALEAQAEEKPGILEVARRARQLPSILGFENYETFRSVRVADLLARLDAGLFRDAARVFSEPLERTSVRLVERERKWAKVRFLSRDAEGRETYEDRDVVFVEGKWVLNDWYVDWPKYMESWRSSLEALSKERAEKPGWLREALGRPDRVLDYLSKTFEPTLRHFSGADQSVSETRKSR